MKIIKVIFPKKFSAEKISTKPIPQWMQVLGNHMRELSTLQKLPEWYREHVKLVKWYKHPFWVSRKPLVKNDKIYIPTTFFLKQKPIERVKMIIYAVATSHKQKEVGGHMPYMVGRADYQIFGGQNGFHHTFAQDIDDRASKVLAEWIRKFGGVK